VLLDLTADTWIEYDRDMIIFHLFRRREQGEVTSYKVSGLAVAALIEMLDDGERLEVYADPRGGWLYLSSLETRA